jgi:hypothetical protein
MANRSFSLRWMLLSTLLVATAISISQFFYVSTAQRIAASCAILAAYPLLFLTRTAIVQSTGSPRADGLRTLSLILGWIAVACGFSILRFLGPTTGGGCDGGFIILGYIIMLMLAAACAVSLSWIASVIVYLVTKQNLMMVFYLAPFVALFWLILQWLT